MKVDGKLALITGGSRGLGRGFADALLQKGAKVCLLDVNLEAGIDSSLEFNEKYGPGSSLFIKCDVTLNKDMTDAFSKAKSLFGHIDIVVNNAGIIQPELWEEAVQINLIGLMRGTRLALEHMKYGNGGRGGLIINIGSISGLTPFYQFPAYVASKFGVVGYSRSIGRAVTVVPDFKGIRVSCLCPSYTDTAMKKVILDSMQTEEERRAAQAMVDTSLMKVEDVTRAFLALVEDDRAHGGVLEIGLTGTTYHHPKKLKGSRL